MRVTNNEAPLSRRMAAEFLGTGFLVAVVVGSGIAAQRLSPGDTGLQLLENAVATAAGLAALIVAFGPVSGAHFNPAVSLVDAAFSGLTKRELGGYVSAQVAGGVTGCVTANVMFSEPAVSLSTTARSGAGLWTAELVATLGLLLVVFGAARSGAARVAPFAVGAYVAAAYFFTASTGFANPAVTVARTLTDTFAGIAPSAAPAFVVAQFVAVAVGVVAVRTLYPDAARVADDVVVPRVAGRDDTDLPAMSPRLPRTEGTR